MEIIDRVKALIADYLEKKNIELVDISYKRQQEGMVLRLLVDTAEGITIKECEGLNNFLSEVLDKEDLIGERYLLEVSSPGLDRPIKTDRDFERAMGRRLEINTFEKIDGKKRHEGKLIGMTKDDIVIEDDGISAVIPRDKISLARLKIEL